MLMSPLSFQEYLGEKGYSQGKYGRQVGSKTKQALERYDPMTHLIPEEMLAVSWSGGHQCPHPPFLAAGSPSRRSMAFSTSSLPTQPLSHEGACAASAERRKLSRTSQPQPRGRSSCPNLCPCLPSCRGCWLPLLPAPCHPSQFAACNKSLPHQIWAKLTWINSARPSV